LGWLVAAATGGWGASPDPFAGSAKATDPQTLDRYSYVSNNPLNASDPTGMAAAYAMVRPPSSAFGDPFAAHEDYTAEDEARYEANLAATLEAVADADAINGMLEAQNLHVVIAQDSKVIDRRIKEITKNAKQLGPNEAAIPTAIEQVVGELIQLHNAIVKFPDGQSIKVDNGYMRAIAYIITDQKGNIIKDPNMSATETIKPLDDNAKALDAKKLIGTTNNQAMPQASNGVFYDFQGRGIKNIKETYQTTQDIIFKSGRKGLWKFEGNKITTDDTARSITIEQGKIRKFY
jgi:hypothetical protein